MLDGDLDHPTGRSTSSDGYPLRSSQEQAAGRHAAAMRSVATMTAASCFVCAAGTTRSFTR